MKNKIKLIPKILYITLVLLILFISGLTLLSVLGIPKNAQLFAVETGSMEPTISTGSLVFVSQKDSYEVGDIITYKSNLGKIQPKDTNVTHRITSVKTDNGDTFYETKGDANTGTDPWTANKLDVLGTVNAHVPYLGYLVSFAKTKLGFVVLILIPALVIIILEVMNIAKVLKDIKPEKKFSNQPKLYLEL